MPGTPDSVRQRLRRSSHPKTPAKPAPATRLQRLPTII
jgi:hypothetical protein